MRTSLRLAVALGFGTVLLLASCASAQDRWVGRDKALHFGVSATLALGGWAAGLGLFDREPPRFVLGATVAIGAGVAKELYDWGGRGDPSWRDVTWNLLGAGVGLLIGFVIDRLWVDEPEESPSVASHRERGGRWRFANHSR